MIIRLVPVQIEATNETTVIYATSMEGKRGANKYAPPLLEYCWRFIYMNSILLDALKAIPPKKLDYTTWVNLGMALKHEGYACKEWDDWSRNDERYKPGECERKWNSFQPVDNPVTGGTIIKIAQEYGWIARYDPMDWDAEITNDENDEVHEDERITDLPPAEQLITYLNIMFEPDDHVAYVTTDVWQDDEGIYHPGAGYSDRTVDELISAIKKRPDDLGATLGDWPEEFGGLIMINPCDGKGVKQENITRYAHALLECDTIPKKQQIILFKEH